jgi:hypothetical protein
MTRFLDELARELARPMPRSRALRLVGGALVSTAAAGVFGKSSTAARRPRGAATRLAERVCYESTSVETGCGYMPLIFNCPRVDRPGGEPCGPGIPPDCCHAGERCCSDGPPRTPDTLPGCPGGAVRPDGYYCCLQSCECYKGACCPPGGPRGTDMQGHPICCDPGKDIRDGLCVEKTCGPDITDELQATLARVKRAFGGWSGPKRYTACLGLVTLPAARFSWDIFELGPQGREKFAKKYQPECSTCGLTVQVGRDCHYAGSVNYVSYGLMMRLCHDDFVKDDSSVANWFSQEEMLEMVYIHKSFNWSFSQGANFQASNEWALVGYRNGSIRPTPPGDRRNECKELCPEEYSGRGFTVNWLPETIGP